MKDIGKYHIESKLGQGGMGIVYKCRCADDGSLAAIKVLPQQLASDANFFQRFKREVMTLQRLDHPNIVKIFDRGIHDGAPYYAMEYVDGVSLEDMLPNGTKMDAPQAIGIVRTCAEALQHSHSLGVVHRDIKPANIMLNKAGDVRLMDFGIAKVLDATRMTVTQGVLGTVEYMSPEQSEGRLVTARSDLYSLGVVLYRCLTGRLPISGSSPSEVVIKLKTAQVDPPISWVPEIPRNLSDLVMRLLEKEPTKRHESAQELIRELDRITQQIETGKTGASNSTRVIHGQNGTNGSLLRNPWLYVFGIVVIVVVYSMFLTTHDPAPSDLSVPANRRKSMRANRILIQARNAAKEGMDALAKDLCRIVIRHFPDSEKAKEALELIADIEKNPPPADKDDSGRAK
jgi:serine/threonine protein kinase